MAISTHLLLLLMVYSVSSDQKVRHLYHISTVHFSPFHTSSPEFPLTVQLNGENLVPERADESRRNRRREELTDLQEGELSIPLLHIIYNSSVGDQRNMCEIDRSSRGVVTLLNSTADPGSSALYWTQPDYSGVQCLVLDTEDVLDHADEEEEGSPGLSGFCRFYLVQSCMERIIGDGYNDVDGRRTALDDGTEDDWFTVVTSLTLDDITDWVMSYPVSLGLYIRAVSELKGNDIFPLQAIGLWGIYTQDRIILTGMSVLMGFNRDKMVVQGVLVLWIISVLENSYTVYFLALLAYFEENKLMLQSFALSGVYYQDRIILTGITLWTIYYPYERLEGRLIQCSSSLNIVDIQRYAVESILSVILRIKNKFKRRKAAKTPAEEATREDLNDSQAGVSLIKGRLAASMEIPLTLAGDDDDDDDDEGHYRLAPGLTPAGRRLAASMDIPLTLAGDKGQNRLAGGLTPTGRRLAASMDIPLTLGRFAASMDIPLTLAGDEGENRLAAGLTPAGRRFAASMDIPPTLAGDDGENKLAAGLNPAGRRFAASMDIPLTLAGDGGQNRQTAGLTPAGRRFAASMYIPLTLADDDDDGDGDEGENRLTAGLTPAGQRLAASMDIPLTLAEKTEASDQ